LIFDFRLAGPFGPVYLKQQIIEIEYMSGLIVLWNAPQPKTYKRVLLRYNEGRKWRRVSNWKLSFYPHKWLIFSHFRVIMPFLRFVKCNGNVELGFGNHYLEIGW
jgi:hypothetical protein